MASEGRTLYDALGVGQEASPEQIRAAYRSQAWQYHPDRNAETDAELRFQEIQFAYATLIDDERRAGYDQSLAGRTNGQKPREGLRPVRCSECGRTTAQPRILTFKVVRSYVVWSTRSRVEGVFCVGCARATGLRASLLTALAGWWSVPLGPFLTWGALAANATGGLQWPGSERLLLLNAEAFMERREIVLAYALARQARISSNRSIALEAARIMQQLHSLGVSPNSPILRNPWRPSLSYVCAHLAFALVGPCLVVGGIVLWSIWGKAALLAVTAGG